jgi:hypothetical protein
MGGFGLLFGGLDHCSTHQGFSGVVKADHGYIERRHVVRHFEQHSPV